MDAKLAIGIPAMAMEIEPLYVVDLIDFEDLYRREYPGLVAVAAALSGASRDAEDLVQDTMVKALINWKRVQRLDRPGGWCHRVLLNICRNWRRRRATEARFISRLRRAEPTSPGPSAATTAFWQAVRQLPTRPRTAVALYYAADRTIAEVAAILGVPEGTVKSDLSRARVAIIKELEG